MLGKLITMSHKLLMLSSIILVIILINGCGVSKSDLNNDVPKYKITGVITSVTRNITTVIGAYTGHSIYDFPGDVRVFEKQEYTCFGSNCFFTYNLSVPAGVYEITALQDVVSPIGLSPGDRFGRPTSTMVTVNGNITGIDINLAVY
jgi:hypothetical protein